MWSITCCRNPLIESAGMGLIGLQEEKRDEFNVLSVLSVLSSRSFMAHQNREAFPEQGFSRTFKDGPGIGGSPGSFEIGRLRVGIMSTYWHCRSIGNLKLEANTGLSYYVCLSMFTNGSNVSLTNRFHSYLQTRDHTDNTITTT